jgi:regulation of enolase protein 1 (concanavalin A-like superfamily)
VNRGDFYAGTTLVGTATTSPYSVTWNNVAAGSYSLTAKVTDSRGGTATSGPVVVSVTSTTLPAPWATEDVGSVDLAGSVTYLNGTFSLKGAGADIWGTTDAFRFVYQPLNGDGQIIARVASLQNTNGYAKGGVMIRETLAANSIHAMMVVTPVNGAEFSRRVTTGGTTAVSALASVAAPYWVKLVRSASTFSGYVSADGVNWAQVASSTVAMASSVYVGLAVTSHDTALCSSTQDGVSVTGAAATPPSVMITAPANGASFVAPATIAVTATATAGTGATVNRVDFYAGTTLVGAATASPYGVTWNNVAAGSYSMTAKVTDSLGGTATSSPVVVSVTPTALPTVMITAPANGASFSSPATIPITATATAGTGAVVSLVEFYAGTTLVGTATTSPYSVTWNNVAAGSYSLTAKVTDTLGGTATSSPAAISVTNTALPSPWATQDIGSVGLAGSAAYLNGTFSLKGAGSDIWGTADAFRFVYKPLTGDGQIIARVASLQNTNMYAKGGVMIRQSLTANSIHALMDVTPGNGAEFSRRTTAGGTTTATVKSALTAPYWVKLVRSGNTFTGSVSADGVTWVQVGSSTISMTGTVYLGLIVTSHSNTALCTTTFDGVQ